MQPAATVSLEETPDGASPAISSLRVSVSPVVSALVGKLQALSMIIGLVLLLIIPGCGQPS
jgi:hypothetical protein